MCCASLPRLSTPPIQFPPQIRISHLNNCSSVQRIFKLHGCNRLQQLNDDVISDHKLQVLCSDLARLKNLLLKENLVNRAYSTVKVTAQYTVCDILKLPFWNPQVLSRQGNSLNKGLFLPFLSDCLRAGCHSYNIVQSIESFLQGKQTTKGSLSH